jgi:hypothetical protein
MAGAEPAASPKIQTRFLPTLMARPVSPPIQGRMNRGNVACAETFGHIVDDI